MRTRWHVLTGMVAAVGLLAGCNTTPTQDGAVVGSALGAGLGAIIGNQSGDAGEGALIGAGVGALTGALVGDQVDEERRRARQGYAQPAPVAQPQRRVHGHYETRVVHGPNGETYEERVWVPHN